ncbi:type II toxin-antitoxin system VapC family toxin [Campylobacter sp. RM16187]|uniref:type II toxin-antitoxin system VapC family toxin n=1 Tax=Campylobacter sp. RM16187 TaxID=1660063 RepID=UPI0021B53545|nr:type II toxin-antitoxin system VapC family toxin [Campylobacter sp. RM16187]QKG28760.1 putative PIN domain protein [Campylobacter sp. RM16187]
MKVFLDTNIIISYLDSERVDHLEATKLISDFYKKDIFMIISQDIMTNVIYNCTNKKEAVESFHTINNNEHFAIVAFSSKMIDLACKSYLKSGNFSKKSDFEDILQYFCALENGCDRIYTNDKSTFPKLDIPLFNSNSIMFYKP